MESQPQINLACSMMSALFEVSIEIARARDPEGAVTADDARRARVALEVVRNYTLRKPSIVTCISWESNIPPRHAERAVTIQEMEGAKTYVCSHCGVSRV
jgi:hypothetical protein